MSHSSSEHPRPEFSQRLRGLLEQRGWSQNELAKRSKIDKGTMSRLMKGRSLTHENVQRLAGALELSPQALLQEGPWPDLALDEPPCDQPSEFVQRAEDEDQDQDEDEPKRAPELKRPPELGHASEAEQIAQLKTRIVQLERSLKNSEKHCFKTKNQNFEFCCKLSGYERDIAALIIQRDQAIAEREQALAWLRAAQQQLQEDQAAEQVVDTVLGFLGGALTGAGFTGALCKGKIDRLEEENKYWKDHAAFLQRELEEERRRRGAVAQQGAQLQAPTPSEPTEAKPLALKPFQFDSSNLQKQLAQLLATPPSQVEGASAPSEGGE